MLIPLTMGSGNLEEERLSGSIRRIHSTFQKQPWGTRTMAQGFRTLAAPAEDHSLISRTHLRDLSISCNSSSRRHNTSGTYEHVNMCVDIT